MTETCAMCLREGLELTKHHLIPRTTHKRKRVKSAHAKEERQGRLLWICRSCHNQVHATLSEHELATEYNTEERLFGHPGIATYIHWIRGRKVRGKIPVKRKRS